MKFLGIFERIVMSSKVQVAFIAFLTALMVVLRIDPARQTEILTLAGGSIALGCAIILATGYEDGKLKEGTVPDGSTPANPGVTMNVNPIPSTPLEPLLSTTTPASTTPPANSPPSETATAVAAAPDTPKP